MTGVNGESFEHGYCPTDEAFASDYIETVKKAAQLLPDLIMLDDDYRLNARNYYLGCFCSEHLKEFYRLVGEEVPREKIASLMFSGGRNKYRDAYMDMAERTLIGFAEKIRAAVDEINPEIRVGICSVETGWDLEGTDPIALTKTLAGKTKPFLRGFGAPYHKPYSLVDAIEKERIQMSWVKEAASEVEAFSEGDLYPRPKYNVPSKALELFDLAMLSDGKADGILKYMFDYTQNVGYETGYIMPHIKNLPAQRSVRELFEGKKTTGIYIFCPMHRIREWVFSKPDALAANKVVSFTESAAAHVFSRNSIPTCYEASEYPIAVFGESARTVKPEMLKNGAILDAKAAEILSERGIDTGLISSEECTADSEYYVSDDDTVTGISDGKIRKIQCRKEAKVLSYLKPTDTPGSYLYENKDGIRFFVLADILDTEPYNTNYLNNYYRRRQLFEAVRYIAGKSMVTVAGNNPKLYVMAAKSENALAVLIENLSMDDVSEPEIVLDCEYESVKFVNCDGKLSGDRVYLTDIAPYGFAALEVTKK